MNNINQQEHQRTDLP